MKRGKPDANQTALDALAQRIGAEWIPLSLLPNGGADRVYLFRGMIFVAEIKNPERSWEFTESELRLQDKCQRQGIPYFVIETDDDLRTMLGV